MNRCIVNAIPIGAAVCIRGALIITRTPLKRMIQVKCMAHLMGGGPVMVSSSRSNIPKDAMEDYGSAYGGRYARKISETHGPCATVIVDLCNDIL